jgi:hypothetical protein
VTGSVPDIRPYAQRSALSIAPLRIARGANKILESLAMGVPVIAAPPPRAASMRRRRALAHATEPREYVDAMLHLLDEPEPAPASRPPVARVLSHHDWRASMRRLDELIGQCMETAHNTSRPRAAVMRVSVFGLGYVGAVSALCLVRDGHTVIGCDVDLAKLDLLRRGHSPIVEPGMSDLVTGANASGRFRVTSDTGAAVAESDLSLYCVATPAAAGGAQDLTAIRRLTADVGTR